MNYTEYPAMADFVNHEMKVAIFILDAARYLNGVNMAADSDTKTSEEYFR